MVVTEKRFNYIYILMIQHFGTIINLYCQILSHRYALPKSILPANEDYYHIEVVIIPDKLIIDDRPADSDDGRKQHQKDCTGFFVYENLSFFSVS
jgi:hypothetical protein